MEWTSNQRVSKSAIKSPAIKVINCELGKDGAGCLTNFCEAVAACIAVSGAATRFASVVTGTADVVTPTAGVSDVFATTALASNTTVAAPSGTPADGQKLILRFLDDGTGRTLTWNAIYRAVGITLPTTTTANKTTYVTLIYNVAAVKWDAIHTVTQA